MSALEQRYQGRVKVIRINIDEPQAQPLLQKYKVIGTPTIILLDRRGQVAADVPGFPGEATVTGALDKLLAMPSAGG